MVSLLRQLMRGHGSSTRPEATTKGRSPQVASSTPEPPCAVRHAGAIPRAKAHAKAGELAQSLSLLAEALVHDPDDPELLYARALTLCDWGRLRESLDSLRAAESRGLTGFGLQLNTAQLCLLLGFAEEAEQRARHAIALDPSSAAAQLCLASALQASRRYEEAARVYERAFALAPDHAECLGYIATCKLHQKDAAGAEAATRRAIALDGGEQAKSWATLGAVLARQDRNGEALEAFNRAEEIENRTGQQSETFVDHGLALLNCGRVSEALRLYGQALPSQPHPTAQAQYGLALLTIGNYREGWEQYEFRRFVETLASLRPALNQPMWNGQGLEGKTVLVWAEQGIGDAIQFARFARQLKAKGATVVLHARENLQQIALDLVGIDRAILNRGEIHTPVDYHISLLSLPRVLCRDIASIPAEVPYLRTDPVRVARWRALLGSDAQLKLGVVWAGNPGHENDRRRSLDLAKLGSLWGVEGVRYFSLQKERRDDEARQSPGPQQLVDLAAKLHDLRDTAAAIDALDLVITVDTAVAHIAGALGKPVWVLLPAAADFRWLRDRDDSPWYPTMRLFRQRQPGQWDEVIRRVTQALRAAAQAQDAGERLAALLPVKKTAMEGEASLHCASERLPTVPSLSRVAEARYGIMQYMPDQNDIARSIEVYGEWLQPQVDLLGKLLRPGATILEAPSGIGAHVLALARMNGPNGHLLAYETDALVRRMLLENVRANRLERVVTVMRRRLAGTGSEGPDVRTTSVVADAASANLEDAETIDGLLLARLDLLKLNRGAQNLAILEGAAKTLWSLRPKLFLSLSEEGKLAQLIEYVRRFGYRCWRTASSLYRQDNFNCCDVDIFPGLTEVALVAIPEESDIDITADGCTELRS